MTKSIKLLDVSKDLIVGAEPSWLSPNQKDSTMQNTPGPVKRNAIIY